MPTWAYLMHYTSALASSAFPMLRLCDPPCGEVRPVASRAEVGSVSMFYNYHEDDLGLLSTPAVQDSRRGIGTAPELDCVPFWFKP